jgi:predicted ribosome quality control (RQC) complex YloA/Tae2 family protein
MFDVLTVAAVADELQGSVLDGRIQKLGLVDATTIAMEVYRHGRRWPLVISADTATAGIWLADRLPSTDPSLITPFGLQLRKYVRGGYIIGLEQPPLERLVRLSIVKRLDPGNERSPRREPDNDEPEDADEADMWDPTLNRVDLCVEIMGRHSNVIMVDAAGLVMESGKRVTSAMSRVRPILPKVVYTLPPPPDRPDPRRVTSAGVEQVLTGAKPSASLADVLVRGLRGVSPQIAREVAFRSTGSAATRISELEPAREQELARQIRSILEPLLTRDWRPMVYEQEGEPIGYAALPMQHLAAIADEREVGSVSEAVQTMVDTGGGTGPRDHAQRRSRLVAAIDREIDRVRGRLHGLQEQFKRAEQTEQLREWGELIYAWLWQISPGDTELVVDSVRVPLDPRLSAKDQAQAYFDEYRKSQRAGQLVPQHLEQTEVELRYLEQLRTQSGQAEGFAAIEALRHEFEEHTGGRQSVGERKGSTSRKKPDRRVTGLTDAAGNLIFIGRSGRENDQVTFDVGGADDTWLHARGVPGSHVIIRWLRPQDDEEVETIETAAALAAYYSSGRESGQVEVDVTRRRNVRKIKGAGPGMVTYRNERTILVRPTNEATLKEQGKLD